MLTLILVFLSFFFSWAAKVVWESSSSLNETTLDIITINGDYLRIKDSSFIKHKNL